MNSSSPCASERNQLQELFDSPHTGAVTIRTATLTGFRETSEHTVCLLRLCLVLCRLTRLGGRPYNKRDYLLRQLVWLLATSALCLHRLRGRYLVQRP
jgi:hypothetical protein